MSAISRINIYLNADTKLFNKNLKAAQRNLRRVGRNMQRMGQNINRSIALPMGAASVAGIKLASDLEKSFSKIENLVGSSVDDLAKYKEGVKGLSSEVGRSQQELSEALFTVTSAGKEGEEALVILERAAKASAIGLGNTNDVARAGTAIMTAYADTGLTAADAMDQFAAVIRQGNLESETLAPTIGKVLGPAKALGISFAEAGANIATMTRLGTSAEESVTGLGAIMSAFIKPAGTANEALESVGWSMDEVKKSIRERGLAKTLVDLQDRFKGNEEALAKVIPNVRALKTVLGTAGLQGEEYIEISEAIANSTGLVDEGFRKVSETSAFKFDQAMVGLKNAGIELGAVLLPLAVKLAQKITVLADKFANLDKKTIKIGLSIAGAVVVGGNLLLLMGKLAFATANILPTIKKLTLFIKGSTAAQRAFNLAIKASPLFLFASIVLGVVQAVRSYKEAATNLKDRQLEFNSVVLTGKEGLFDYSDALIRNAKILELHDALEENLTNRKLGYWEAVAFARENDYNSVRKARKAFREKMDEEAKIIKQNIALLEFLNDAQKNKPTKTGTGTGNGEGEVKGNIEGDGAKTVYKHGALKFYGQLIEFAELAKRMQSEFTEEFNGGLQKIDTTTKGVIKTESDLAIQRMATVEGMRNRNEVIDEQIEKWRELSKSIIESEDALRLYAGVTVNTFTKMGQALASGDKNWKTYAVAALEAIRDIIKGLIAMGTAKLVEAFLSDPKTSGMPWVKIALAAAGGGIAVGLFDAAISKIQEPKLAKGGLAYGPTLATVGDNPNARINPEVIAPLSDLKRMMGGNNVNLSGEFVIKGRDLVFLVEHQQQINKRLSV